MPTTAADEVEPLTPPSERADSPPPSKVEGDPPSADKVAAHLWLRNNSLKPSEQKSDTRGLRLPQNARRTSEVEEWDPLEEDDDYKIWRKAQFFGGGIGKAALYIEVDDAYNVVDRIVVKDTPLSEQSWRDDSRKWHGWTANGADEDRVPIEWWTHFLACTRPEARYIIRLRGGPCLDSTHLIYRIYVEYASRGDLATVIETYWAVNARVPWQFIMFVLKALAECGLIMEQGGIDFIPNDWKQIIRRDLKPDNVFLDTPRSHTFPMWPHPKLADFGLAFLTSPDDPTNPILHNYGAGIVGYHAPEQLSIINDKTLKSVHDFKLLSPCNVWGVGAILHNLMSKNFFNEQDQPDYLDTGLEDIDPDHLSYFFSANERRRGGYPEELYTLVEDCLKVDPAQRPTFRQLLEFVERHEQGNLYFRQAAKGKQEYDLGLMVSPETEKYCVGFSLWETDVEGYRTCVDQGVKEDADIMMEGMGELDLFF